MSSSTPTKHDGRAVLFAVAELVDSGAEKRIGYNIQYPFGSGMRLIFKSPVATLLCRPPEAYTMCYVRNVECQYLYVFIRDHVMHPNTSVNSVNEHY